MANCASKNNVIMSFKSVCYMEYLETRIMRFLLLVVLSSKSRLQPLTVKKETDRKLTVLRVDWFYFNYFSITDCDIKNLKQQGGGL